MSSTVLVYVGLGLIFLGILGIIVGSIGNTNTKFSVVGFLGFIPFGFSNDKKWLVASVVLLAIFFIFYLVAMVVINKRFI